MTQKTELTIDQKLQVARMATDIFLRTLSDGNRQEISYELLASGPNGNPPKEWEIFTKAYSMIEETLLS